MTMESPGSHPPVNRDGRQRGKDPVKRQMVLPQVTPIAVGVLLFAMASVILFKSKVSRGTCSFDHVYRKATCKVKHLTSIPDDIPSAALSLIMGTKLDKADNSFTTLEASNFSYLTQLQDLQLVKCGIQEIKPDTFGQLSSLRRLDLRYNRLQTISESTFRGLTNVEYLYLSNNPITQLSEFTFRGIRLENLILANNPAVTHISGKTFAGAIIKTLVLNRCSLTEMHAETLWHVGDSLKELHITNNLQPLDLPDTIFKGLSLKVLNLDRNGIDDADFLQYVIAEEISLDDNPLEEIDFDDSSQMMNTKRLSLGNTKLKHLSRDDLSQLANLEELDLEQNQLTTLNVSVFGQLTRLQILDLSGNDLELITGIPDEEFPALRSLYLDNNELQSLPSNLEPLFSRLDNLTFHDNPLHCNCELQWLADWLMNHSGIILEEELIRCATPECVNFTQITSLPCRPPTILNATFESDGISLVCTADGDPPPTVSWVGVHNLEPLCVSLAQLDRKQLQSKCTIAISKGGNYTCTATNLAGNDSVVIDTENIPSSGIKFVHKSKRIEILETPKGFMITVALLVLLGYIFRKS